MVSTPAAYVVRAGVTHRRRVPFDYSFSHRTTSWLVDASAPEAAIPRWLRPFARIRAEDHLGPGAGSLHAKVRDYLDANELDWTASRVLLLTNARSLGYVFNPLTTWFCYDAAGRLEGILAEVHNTYGERHCYPLPAQAGEHGSEVGKEFYVSPFFAVEGRYDIRARLTGHDIAVTVTLSQGDRRVFAGSIQGPLVPATTGAVVRAIARNPLAPQKVAALIRFHGIRLWLRRLPVVPRRPHPAPRGM